MMTHKLLSNKIVRRLFEVIGLFVLVGKIYLETKRRPRFIVSKFLND